VLVDGPHFRLDRITGAPDAATLAAYPGAALVLPLSGEVAARDGSARVAAGECLVTSDLATLDFGAAGVTLLTRAA
jgi:mannose-6-phosphate isomerase